MGSGTGRSCGTSYSNDYGGLVEATEFEKYRVIQDRLFMSDFDKYLLKLEGNAKK